MDRRQFLISNLSLGALALTGCSPKSAAKQADQLVFSACTDVKNQHYAAAFTPDGQCYFIQPIKERAHHSEYLPNQKHALFFARSPGTEFYVVDINTKTIIQTVKAPEGRYYSGHGVIDKDDQLYVTENDAKTHQGYLGVYEPINNYKRTRSFATHGIEPHQVLLNPVTHKLIVANGGLIKEDGEIINTENFESSVAYLDPKTGALENLYMAPAPQNSLRHMALDSAGQVYIGAQSYNSKSIPLIFKHKDEGQLVPFEAEEYVWDSHNQYTASLAEKNGILAVTSPRGNIVSFWNANTGKMLEQKSMQDCAGLVTLGHKNNLFTVTSGVGRIAKVSEDKQHHLATDRVLQDQLLQNLSWDNHLSYHDFTKQS